MATFKCSKCKFLFVCFCLFPSLCMNLSWVKKVCSWSTWTISSWSVRTERRISKHCTWTAPACWPHRQLCTEGEALHNFVHFHTLITKEIKTLFFKNICHRFHFHLKDTAAAMNLPDQRADHAKRSGQVMQDWHTAERKPMTRLPFKPHATHAGGWLKHSDCPVMLPPLSPALVFWSQQGVRTHTHTHMHTHAGCIISLWGNWRL